MTVFAGTSNLSEGADPGSIKSLASTSRADLSTGIFQQHDSGLLSEFGHISKQTTKQTPTHVTQTLRLSKLELAYWHKDKQKIQNDENNVEQMKNNFKKVHS